MKKKFLSIILIGCLMIQGVSCLAEEMSFLEQLSEYAVGENGRLVLKEKVAGILTESQKDQLDLVVNETDDVVNVYLTMPFVAGKMDEDGDAWTTTKQRVNDLNSNRIYKAGLMKDQKQMAKAVIDGAVYYSQEMIKSNTWQSKANQNAYLRSLLAYYEMYFEKRELKEKERYWPEFARSKSGEFILNDDIKYLFSKEQQGWMATLITTVADFMAEAASSSYIEALLNNPTYFATINDIVITKMTKSSIGRGLDSAEKQTVADIINIILNLSQWSIDSEWWEEEDVVKSTIDLLEIYLNTCCETIEN